MTLRIRCRSIVNGVIRETTLPDTHSDADGPSRLCALLETLIASRAGWTVRGPIDVDEAHPRWDLYDKDGIWTASYQLVQADDE
jgi:hypothetical protein